jgi:hypothetical protein
MQPCAGCGSPGVDAAGYCVQCRTYRGPPAATDPSRAGSVTGAAHPTSGNAFGYPTSGAGYRPPGHPPPGPAGYPAVPAYPDPGQPAKPPRSPLVVPLIALSITLVVAVVAIVVVVVVRSRSGGGPAPGAKALVDRCVVGTWRTDRYQEDVPVAGVGSVRFTGQGAQVRLAADGTGVTDYGSGTTYTATINGVGYRLAVSGTVRFGYRTDNGTVSFTGVTANGTEILTRTDTGQQVTDALSGSSDPARYTCAGDQLVEFTNQYRAELHRIG